MSKKLGIKTNDTVVVISGPDKKKTGKVIAAMPDEDKVLVEGVNMVTKHHKARSVKQQSGIRTQAAPIHVSNVMIMCPTCKEATRTAKKVDTTGKKIRVCKNCGAELDK